MGPTAPALNILELVYSIVGIELTIRWNSIRDVYSINTTGQLIPFVIGLVGLVEIIYGAVKDYVTHPQAMPQVLNNLTNNYSCLRGMETKTLAIATLSRLQPLEYR